MNMFSLDLSYQPNLFKANFVYVREICMDGLFQLTSAQVHLKWDVNEHPYMMACLSYVLALSNRWTSVVIRCRQYLKYAVF